MRHTGVRRVALSRDANTLSVARDRSGPALGSQPLRALAGRVLLCLTVWLPLWAGSPPVLVDASPGPQAAARSPAPPAATSAEQLARALQRKYDAVRDFSTDFVHAYEGGVLKKRLTERGRLLIKKPGKMRWEYSAPERKLFVSDGVTLYSYVPQDRQVFVSPVSPDDRAATPALFLAGKGDLIRDFAPSLVTPPPGLPAGVLTVKLVPKSAQQDYDWLILAVDPSSLGIRGLVTVDAQGGTSTFSFTNLQENVGLADRQFTFTVPHGVEVVRESGVGR